ncbi:MAG: transposase, partial [Cytophagaceae bacterium]
MVRSSLVRLCKTGVPISKWSCTGSNGSGRPSGKPTQNAYIERFNGTFRREVLNANTFSNLAHLRQTVQAWLMEYNT